MIAIMRSPSERLLRSLPSPSSRLDPASSAEAFNLTRVQFDLAAAAVAAVVVVASVVAAFSFYGQLATF